MSRSCLLLAAALGFAASVRPLPAQDSLATRARHLAAAGDFRQAASTWRLVLQARPDDRSALAGLVDALEATGDWRTAIAPLDRLLELDTSDPARLRQRGYFAAWSGDLDRGAALLRRAVAQSSQNPAYLAALAQVLSWSPATREEAARTFTAALSHDSNNPSLFLGYADLLSWTPRSRDSAAALYRRILSRWPNEPRARVGLANLLAWDGKPGRALRSYDSVLAGSPDDVGALRGRGGALNQLGRPAAAAQSLERALQLSPRDAAATGELARAELGSGRFRSARARLEGRIDPALRGVADSALRATASAAEVAGLVRGRKNQLDVSRLTARTTGAVGSLKLFAEYERSELRDGGAGFRSEGYGGGARVDYRGLALLAAGRMQTVQGLGTRQWDGSLNFGWRIAEGISLAAGATRSPVEETRRTVQGALDGSQLRGAVHANLAQFTLALDNLPGPFDAEGMILAGDYTGLGLESNRREAAEARIGIVLRRSQPWIRIGYGFAASRFDYNADLGFAQTATQQGGYFSPAEYWRHQGILQFSQRFGSRVRWEADARMGREWVRQLKGSLSDSRNAATASSKLTMRLSAILDLEARFLYVNAFDAFELKEFASALKVYLP